MLGSFAHCSYNIYWALECLSLCRITQIPGQTKGSIIRKQTSKMFCQRILSIWTCFVICWLTINSRLTFQSSVPLLVWSNTPSSSSSGVIDKQSFNTLVDSIDTKDLIEDYSKLKTPIAVFVQKDLSLEQFSSNEAPFVASLFTQSHLNPVCSM